MQKKRFSDLSPRGKGIVSVVLAVSLVLIAAAQRDLQQRPASEIRGAKAIWRLLCLNGLGAATYFLWGRRNN